MKKMKKLASLLLAAGMLMSTAANVSAYVYQSPKLMDNGNVTGVIQDYEKWTVSRVTSGAHRIETKTDDVYGKYLSVGNAGQYYYNFEETVSSGKYVFSFDAKFPHDTSGVKMYLANTTAMDGTAATFTETMWLRSDAIYLPYLRNDVDTGVPGNNFVWQANSNNILYQNGEWVHYDLVFCMDPENGNRFIHVYNDRGLARTIYLSNDSANKGIKSFAGFMWLDQSGTPLALDNVVLSKVESNFVLGTVNRDNRNLVVNATEAFTAAFAANNATKITRVPDAEPTATPEEVPFEVVSINGGIMTLKPQDDLFQPGYRYQVTVKRQNGENLIDSVTTVGHGVKLSPYVYQPIPETRIFQNFDGAIDGISSKVTIKEDAGAIDGRYASMMNGGVYRYDVHSGKIKAEKGTWRLSFDYKMPTTNAQFGIYVHTASAADPTSFKQAKPFIIHAGGIMNRMKIKKETDAWMFGNNVINNTDWHHVDMIFNLDNSNVGTKNVDVYVDGVHSVNEIIYRVGKESTNNVGQADYIYSIDNVYFDYTNDSTGGAVCLDNIYFGTMTVENRVMVGTSVLKEDEIELNAGVNFANTVSANDFDLTRTTLGEQRVTTSVTDFTFTKTSPTKGIIKIADFASGYEYDIVSKKTATQCGVRVDFPNYKIEKTIDWGLYDLAGNRQTNLDEVSPATNKIVFTISNGLKDNQLNGTISLTDEYTGEEIEYTAVCEENTITLYLKSVLDEIGYYTLSAEGMLDAEGKAYETISKQFVTGERAEDANKLVDPVIVQNANGLDVLLQYANVGEETEEITGYVIYCGYQGNQLAMVDFKPLSIAQNDTKGLQSFGFTDANIASYSRVEVFVWDGFTTMEPLVPSVN